MCRAPFIVSRWPSTRPAVDENGGFITMTVGFTSSGSMLFNWAASTLKKRAVGSTD
jgi:hypothetical protein